MQINRLFEIVYILLNKKQVTAKELAKRFEVSVRTIYRDIETLSAAGIPVYANPGKGGGIALLDGYVLDRSVLSESEQNEILFALQSLSAAQSPDTASVFARLSSLFRKDSAGWIEVDLSPWGSDKRSGGFAQLKEAILSRRVIEFAYFSGTGEKSRRRVEPVRLVFKVNAWYLRGFCRSRNAFRIFKLSRMADVRVTEAHFVERPEPPDDAPEQSAQRWIDVRLKFSPDAAYRVYDEFSEADIAKDPDGTFTVAAGLPDSGWLIGYILSFGGSAEVLEPPTLRDRIREQARLIFENSK